MPTIGWIVLLVVAVVVVGLLAWYAGQRRRSQRLQDRFGPEYDRAVETTGKKAEAEKELEARQERVDSLDIRPLSVSDRESFQRRWQVVQATFVDDPATAVDDADKLIGDVMRARGYPVGDFEQRAADISVDHPQVVDHYRTAHAIAMKEREGKADTEALRQAMVHDRALFSDLLETADTGDAAASPGERGAETPAANDTTPADRTPTEEPVATERSPR